MILFTDLDDTLLSRDKTISEGNRNAILDMVSQGHSLCLCTGRPLYSALILAREYGFIGKNMYIAAFNGGQIIDTLDMKELYHEGVSFDVVKVLFEEAPKWGLNVQTYTDEHVLVEEDSDYIKWYTNRIRMPYRVVDSVLDELADEPLKCIVAHISDHDRLVEFRKTMSDRMDDITSNLFSNPVLLEYGSNKAGKGIAIEVLCNALNIPVSDSVAAGDEENDIDMLTTAGTGVAVSNAVETVKRVADAITENDCDNDAIAEIISKYILKKEH